MKTAVIYASKYGTTESCAKQVADALKADLISLERKSKINLSTYDRIILGSSVYIGKLRKPMRQFIENNKSALSKQTHGIFVCCSDTTEFKGLYPDSLEQSVKNTGKFGYEIKYEQMKFIDRIIMKKVSEQETSASYIDQEAIQAFINKMNT